MAWQMNEDQTAITTKNSLALKADKLATVNRRVSPGALYAPVEKNEKIEVNGLERPFTPVHTSTRSARTAQGCLSRTEENETEVKITFLSNFYSSRILILLPGSGFANPSLCPFQSVERSFFYPFILKLSKDAN
jgi:hypothetical protein